MKLRTMVINQIVYSRACAARYFNGEIMSKKNQSWTGKKQNTEKNVMQPSRHVKNEGVAVKVDSE